MAKKLVQNYTFDPTTNTVVINYVYGAERLLLITNVTAGETIFAFNDATVGYSNLSYDYEGELTTLVLNYDCSGMSSTDKLQIFVESDYSTFKPDETFVDPVSKFRVSQPENLIDTDFEYGLQSTKWETLELVKNIPTFFSRSGDASFVVTEMSTVEGSDIVTVTIDGTHDLLSGSPIIAQGTRNRTCDGAFVVTNIIDTAIFQYKAKSVQIYTGSILDTYTQVWPGSVYQGTEFDLTGINAITTDGENTSTLTVNTLYPTNFSQGTSFFLANSVGKAEISIDASQTIAENYNAVTVATTNNSATGEEGGFALGGVQPYGHSGTEVAYFQAAPTIASNAITITGHGLTDNLGYMYVAGEGNTAIGGLTTYNFYYVRVIDANTIYLTTTKSSTTRITLSSAGVNGGVMRSAFIRAYRSNGGSTSSASESWTFEDDHGLASNSSNPLMVFGTTGTLTATTNFLSTGQIYYCKTVRDTKSFSWTTSPGGAQINLSSVGTANAKWMIKVVALEDADSIWFSAHGLSNNSVVAFTSVGTVPSGLTSGTNYGVEVVSPNRIRFKNNTTGATINLATFGATTAQYTIVANIPNLLNDSLYYPNQTFADGAVITYDANGNAAIPGLTDGNTYYVFQGSQNNFKLATSGAGWSTNPITITSFNNSTNVFTSASHGFTTGQAVRYLSSTPITGLINGAWYWVRSASATTFTLHWTKAGANANTGAVDVIGTLTGTHTVQQAALVDITDVGSGTHKLSAVTAGASDGVYTISNITGDNSFEMLSNQSILKRTVDIKDTADYAFSAFFIRNHYLVTGAPVTYTTDGTEYGGLTSGTTYYVVKVSRDYFRLSETFEDSLIGTYITITPGASGTQVLEGTSISGEISGPGTIAITTGSTIVVGNGTNFSAIFAPGDTFKIYHLPTETNKTVTAINTGTNVLTSTGHGLSTETLVIMNAATAPAGTTNNKVYYVRAVDANTLTLHLTPANATANTNAVDITDAGTSVVLTTFSGMGSTEVRNIESVGSKTDLILSEGVDSAEAATEYVVGTALYIRADGAAFHRAYDGGVELTPSTNPDSQMIRQTRKYFRYQSGKGIQVSFAVNFSPSVTVDTMTASGTTATLTTRYPHRLTVGTNIHIYGATVSSGENYWNGDFDVASIIDEYTFTITLDGTPIDTTARGLIDYFVNSWTNSRLKCGLFDDQNGLFFEFDGQKLYCVRRSSVQQISGSVSVTFKSGMVVGTNTKFSSQLNENDKIVIKGQTYVISKISSNTLLYILPSYRGQSATNCVVTKTVDTKVPQEEWSVDPCDGTGPTGFYLDKHRIQMAYMDYSWYGAGKVRFGFKNQEGHVKYVHEFIHNNHFTEAYMRSGNLPGRYEVENVGQPSYVPALAHWGTSVIMDGRFDDDKAYVFTAGSNSITLAGASSLSVTARVETTNVYQVRVGGTWVNAGYALLVPTASSTYNNISSGMGITGTALPTGTAATTPTSTFISPYQPYLAGVQSRYTQGQGTQSVRNLILLDTAPTATSGATSSYTVAISADTPQIVYDVPLISIRLSPSVDNGSPGFLGEREIINRMQLILQQVGILSTHSAEIQLRLNGQLTNKEWSKVTSPSLSQLVYHATGDTIVGGTVTYSFRAQGGSGTTARTPVITTADLGDIATLGNAILGGDNTYPDGPDVLTIVARLVEDPSTVSTTNPFAISGRISWSESQA